MTEIASTPEGLAALARYNAGDQVGALAILDRLEAAVLGERPDGLQLLGVITTLAVFFGLSMAGRLEGVHFHRDKWVGFLLAGTILGAVSSLYDKYLLGRAHFTVPTVQAWFSIYLVVLFTPFAIGWQRRWWERNEFHWRWTIPSSRLRCWWRITFISARCASRDRWCPSS